MNDAVVHVSRCLLFHFLFLFLFRQTSKLRWLFGRGMACHSMQCKEGTQHEMRRDGDIHDRATTHTLVSAIVVPSIRSQSDLDSKRGDATGQADRLNTPSPSSSFFSVQTGSLSTVTPLRQTVMDR